MRQVFTYISILLLPVLVKGQDSQFSQYFSASLFLNPAFSGVYNDPSFHMNFNKQNRTLGIVSELTQVSFVFPIKQKGRSGRSLGGFGLMVFSEQSGINGKPVIKKTAGFVTYGHNFKFGLLSSDIITIGIQAGLEQGKQNWSELSWGSQYNPFFGRDDTKDTPVTQFDTERAAPVVNAGIMYYYNPDRNYLLYSYSAFSGFSVTNVNRPNKSFNTQSKSPEKMRWKYNGGVEIKINKLYMTPSLFFLYQGGSTQINAGLHFAYVPKADRYKARGNQLLLGTSYRVKDSFIFMGGVKFSSMAIRASYDLNSKLFAQHISVGIDQPAFELSLQYSLSKNAGHRKLSNPLF